MSNELPEGYKEGVTRVSNIVSFVHPFEGTDAEVRYLQWLADDVNPKWARGFAISKDDYMDEACTVGTFIHLQMEKYCLGKRMQKSKPLYKKHLGEIEGGANYIDKLNKEHPNAEWVPEQVVLDSQERFQGTIDLIRIDEENKTVYLYDWKTFGIAKKRWKLPNKYKKPTSKLPKVGLQLSLYAETYRQKGYKIGGVYCLYLHETGCYEYKCTLETTEEINELLSSYKESIEFAKKINEQNLIPDHITMSIKAPLKIHLQTAPKAFQDVHVELDLKDLDGQTPEEAIKEAVQVQQKLHVTYMKFNPIIEKK